MKLELDVQGGEPAMPRPELQAEGRTGRRERSQQVTGKSQGLSE